MSQKKLTSREIDYMREAVNGDYESVNIRLREGEYQYALAKAIASFHLELYFPNVKEIIEKLYGKEKTRSIQFRRKIQTILKKMEKSGIVRILQKKKPWELQRYSISSFKFQDVDNSRILLATDQQMEHMHDLLRSVSSQEEPMARLGYIKVRIYLLALIVVASYLIILWNLMQPTLDPTIFVPAFSVAVACSLMLGKALSYAE